MTDPAPEPAALREADDRLRAWLAEFAGGTPVGAVVPADAPERADDDAAPLGLAAHFLSLETATPVARSGLRPAATVLWLRYLVIPVGGDHRAGLGLLDGVLGALVGAAGGRVDGIALDPGPVSEETWRALGVRPRPALVVRARASLVPAAEDVGLVTTPLRLVGGPVRTLTGRVLGPGDVAIAGADVQVEGTGAHARTSPDGAFAFALVPAGQLRLGLSVKGRRYLVDVPPQPDEEPTEPLTIRCDPLEATP